MSIREPKPRNGRHQGCCKQHLLSTSLQIQILHDLSSKKRMFQDEEPYHCLTNQRVAWSFFYLFKLMADFVVITALLIHCWLVVDMGKYSTDGKKLPSEAYHHCYHRSRSLLYKIAVFKKWVCSS